MYKGMSKVGIVVMGLTLGTGWLRADQTPEDSIMQNGETTAGQTLTLGDASGNAKISISDTVRTKSKKTKSRKTSKTKKTKTTKIKRSTSKKSKTKKSRKKSV